MIFVLTILEPRDLELPFFGQALFHVFLLAFVFLFIIADTIFRNISICLKPNVHCDHGTI